MTDSQSPLVHSGQAMESEDVVERPFHPDNNLPGCMMPDGGDCCSGHHAVVEDWHKQRETVASLREEVERLTRQSDGFWRQSEHHRKRHEIAIEARNAAESRASRLEGALKERIEVDFGFASYKDGSFELIARNIVSGNEVTLHGEIQPNQTIEQIDKVLPTCVYVRAHSLPAREALSSPTDSAGWPSGQHLRDTLYAVDASTLTTPDTSGRVVDREAIARLAFEVWMGVTPDHDSFSVEWKTYGLKFADRFLSLLSKGGATGAKP